jgi:hypothetical protein
VKYVRSGREMQGKKGQCHEISTFSFFVNQFPSALVSATPEIYCSLESTTPAIHLSPIVTPAIHFFC